MFDRKGATADAAPKFNQPQVIAGGAGGPSDTKPGLPIDKILERAAGVGGHVIHLSKPLATRSGDVMELQLRLPNWGEFMRIGDVDTVAVTEIDPETKSPSKLEHSLNREALMNWAVALTGHDRIVLGQLSIGDGNKLEKAIRAIVQGVASGN